MGTDDPIKMGLAETKQKSCAAVKDKESRMKQIPVNNWRAMLCLSRAPLATPFGPSSMGFLATTPVSRLSAPKLQAQSAVPQKGSLTRSRNGTKDRRPKSKTKW
jgi:hypothetical protein